MLSRQEVRSLQRGAFERGSLHTASVDDLCATCAELIAAIEDGERFLRALPDMGSLLAAPGALAQSGDLAARYRTIASKWRGE